MPPGRSTGLVVNVVDLRRRLGEQREVEREVTLGELRVAETGVEAGTPIGIRLVLESIPAGVSATGTVTSSWRSACRRCLEPVEGPLSVEVAEVFTQDHVEGDTYPLGRETVDLEPMVRDAVLLALPVAPLCREDCPGPEPDDYPVSVEDEAGGDVEPAEPPRDPRWAALDVLRDQLASADTEGDDEIPAPPEDPPAPSR